MTSQRSETGNIDHRISERFPSELQRGTTFYSESADPQVRANRIANNFLLDIGKQFGLQVDTYMNSQVDLMQTAQAYNTNYGSNIRQNMNRNLTRIVEEEKDEIDD